MADDLMEQLTTPDGRHAFDQRMRQLFQRYAFDKARTELAGALKTRSHPLAALCLELEAVEVRLTGWQQLQQQVQQPDPRLGRLCAAVKLHLSEYTDRMTPEGSEQPSIESLLLHDDRVPFATASLAYIMEHNPRGSAWPGESFGDAIDLVAIEGLDRLNGALKLFDITANGSDPTPVNEALALKHLVEWYLSVRWQTAAAHWISVEGLPRRIPVIVSTHGLVPLVYVAHYPTLSAPPSGTGARSSGWRWPFGKKKS